MNGPILAVVPYDRPSSNDHPAGADYEVLDDGFEDVTAYMDTPATCTARANSGETCTRPVVGPGVQVCRLHGGAAPQVRQVAIDRLKQARDGALDRLIEVLSSNGDRLDPRVLLDITTRLTDKVELLEGRATERTESAEFKLEEVRKSFTVKLDRLAESYGRAPAVLDMVDQMMGEGKHAADGS